VVLETNQQLQRRERSKIIGKKRGKKMLEYAALVLLITMVTFMIYLIIYIHDIPYEIAKGRNHPHQEAIHAAGWVSLFLLHTIWPLLWVWAYLYTPGRGFVSEEGADNRNQDPAIAQLQKQIDDLSSTLNELKASSQ
jgi:hypothetical protein